MVPIKTSIEDVQKLVGYLGKQIGWTDLPKLEKALGKQDDRKIAAMVEFGVILRDGSNLRIAERGQLFNREPKAALLEVLHSVDLYQATIEWAHYNKKTELTTAEIGQYWEISHRDSIGGLSGTTLGLGAVTFGRVVDAAGLGSFRLGRGGKETRISLDSSAIDAVVNGEAPAGTPFADSATVTESQETPDASVPVKAIPEPPHSRSSSPAPTVSVAASPSVHVNIEIHIAADATADTVREIFKNMARYVLDKPTADVSD